MSYIWTRAHTHIQGPRVLKNYITGTRQGLEFLHLIMEKRNTYEFLSGVGTPPPHNEKRNSNLEARHKTKRVLINVTK